MIGMKPDEMREKANQMTNAIVEASEIIQKLQSQMMDIIDRLERIENGNGSTNINSTIAGGGDSSNSGCAEYIEL